LVKTREEAEKLTKVLEKREKEKLRFSKDLESTMNQLEEAR